MAEEARYWTSGIWRVTGGEADEFVDRWMELLRWTKEANDGLLSAQLLRDLNDPHHFLSFASWRDVDSLNAWEHHPGFAERYGKCRAVCTDVQGGNYEVFRTI
jgi:heme-degrading monooxygenase HmoA